MCTCRTGSPTLLRSAAMLKVYRLRIAGCLSIYCLDSNHQPPDGQGWQEDASGPGAAAAAGGADVAPGGSR